MKRLLLFALFLAAWAAYPLAALAEKEETTIEEVVVTATRDAQEIQKIPASVTVINRQEIDRSNAQTVVDVIRTAPGVDVRDYYGTGKAASVDIRGFGETGPMNTLVLVDGRRVNAIDLSGVDWTQIPLDQIERVEIVRGAGSVLYGDNATGGVVNIITRKPDKPFFARGEVTAGSYNLNRESVSAGGKWGAFSAILNASHSSTDGFRENGGLRTKDVGGKLIYDVSDAVSLSLSAGLHTDDMGLPGGLTLQDIDRVGRNGTVNPFNNTSTDDRYAVFGIKARLWDMGRIEADLSYRGRQEDNFFDYPAYFYTYEDRRTLATYGFTPKYILEKALGPFSNKLTAGVDLYRSNSGVDAQSTYGPSASKVTKKSTGFYILDEFSILPQLILSAGAREERVSYESSDSGDPAGDKKDFNKPAFSAALNYLFAPKSNAFLSVQRTFRFPATDELIVVYPEPGISKIMKPQTGYQYEAGVRHAFTNWLEASLSVFQIDLRDEIFYNPATFMNENFPTTRRRGIETGVRVMPCPWFTLWGNYTYTRAELRSDDLAGNDRSGNDIPGVPKHKGSVGADFSFGKGLTLNTRATFVGTRPFISDWANRLGNLDSYYTVDAKLSYAWKGLKAFVGVNNIANQKYSDFGVTNAAGTTQLFYPSPERNFVAGLSYAF